MVNTKPPTVAKQEEQIRKENSKPSGNNKERDHSESSKSFSSNPTRKDFISITSKLYETS